MQRPFRDHALSCVNHVGAGGSACPKCGVVYCAECLPKEVNGAPWCELCANVLTEEVKPRIGLGLLVTSGGLLLLTLLWLGQVMFLNTRGTGFPFLVVIGFPLALYAGLRVTRTTTGDPPSITSRRR